MNQRDVNALHLISRNFLQWQIQQQQSHIPHDYDDDDALVCTLSQRVSCSKKAATRYELNAFN